MKNGRNIGLYVLVVVIVVILIAAIAVMQPGTDVTEPEGQFSVFVTNCNDTDNGINTLVAGTTSGINRTNSLVTKNDYCNSAKKLIEYYCHENYIKDSEKSCPSGYRCSNGACAIATTIQTCTDSDGGINTAQFGQVKINDVVQGSDICSDTNKVIEYYCTANNSLGSTVQTCPANYYCTAGACVYVTPPAAQNQTNQTQNYTCTDSDGGINYDAKGTVISTANGQYTDYCYVGSGPVYYQQSSTGRGLREFFCKADGFVDQKNYENCTYGCSDGACASVTTNQTNQTGSLTVVSNPSVANLYVDGDYKGLTTYTVSGLSVGTHEIQVTKSGYNSYTTLKYIYSGSNSLSVDLTAITNQTG